MCGIVNELYLVIYFLWRISRINWSDEYFLFDFNVWDFFLFVYHSHNYYDICVCFVSMYALLHIKYMRYTVYCVLWVIISVWIKLRVIYSFTSSIVLISPSSWGISTTTSPSSCETMPVSFSLGMTSTCVLPTCSVFLVRSYKLWKIY